MMRKWGSQLLLCGLKKCAKDLADARGVVFKAKNGLPSDEWFDRFVHRMSVKHGINLMLRAPNVLSRLRAAAGNEENATHYYQLLQQIVQNYNIDVSTNVGNLDETFVRFDMKNRRVITERNAKTVFQLSSIVGEQLEHITHL